MNKKLLPFLIIALSLAACQKPEQTQRKSMQKPISCRVIVAGEEQSISTRNYIGEISSESEIPLSFSLGGEIIELCVKNAAHVRKGQVIARVDPTQADAMLESAKAVLDQAEDGYKRAKPVYEKGGISELKWKEIETDLQKARSMYISSKKRQENCTLKAPQDGYVQLRQVEVGQTLAPSQRIGVLLDLNRLTAVFTVPENEVGALQNGQKIEVLIPALNLQSRASITKKDLVSTQLAHTYEVRAAIDDKEIVNQLLPGMVCKAVISNTEKDGITVPASCIIVQKSGKSVWVLKNGEIERRMIEVGEYAQNGVIVREGLCVGDTVITEGYQKLYNGAKINIID